MNEKNNSRIFRILRESGWVIAGQVLAALGLLFLVWVMTKFLNPLQYGELSLALTIGTLVCQITMSGVIPGVLRYYPIAIESDDIHGYLMASKKVVFYGVLATLTMSILVILGAILLGQVRWVFLIILTIFFTQLSSFNSILNGIQNAARQRRVVALHTGLDPWLKVLFISLAFYLFENSVTIVVLSNILSTLIILGSQLYFLSSLENKESKKQDKKNKISTIENYIDKNNNWTNKMWLYSKPLTIFNIFTGAQTSSDRWALEYNAGPKYVGFYAVLIQLGYTPVTIILGLISTIISPILNQWFGDGTDMTRVSNVYKISWRITFFCLLITVMLFLLTFFLHEWIFILLVSNEFQSVSYLLPWVLLAGGIFSAGQILSLRILSELKTDVLVIPKIATAIFGILLNYIGSLYWGINGIVISAIVFSFSYLIWIGLISSRSKSHH